MNMWFLGVQAFVTLMFAALGLGCGDDDGTVAPVASVTASAALAQATPTAPPQDLVDMLKRDLSERVEVDVADIAVVEECGKVWPDGSVGVAEPGQVYTQSLVPGWLVILEAGGDEYRYHGAGSQFIAADFVLDAEIDGVRC